MTHPDSPATLRTDVLRLFAAAGFEVRDSDRMGVFAMNGSIDSAALVVEWLSCGIPDDVKKNFTENFQQYSFIQGMSV